MGEAHEVKIRDAQFLASGVGPKDYPPGPMPEVAFAGRSNVGKSSMINALLGRRKLVRVSNTPGRTRTLNFFQVDVEQDARRLSLRFVDLPGYGFAKVSKSEREGWARMISDYLKARRQLKVAVCIVDAEVGPTPHDVQMLDFLNDASCRILVAATKIDRLSKAQRKPRIAQIARELELPDEGVVPFSATLRLHIEETWQLLLPELWQKQ